MTFPYKKLSSKEFRLLRPVLASPREISFIVEQVPRQHAPSYTAVSYTWGIDNPTETIQLNGRPFRVRPNLWSCLYYLILEAKKGNRWTHLWVDAICIDQTNDQERNAQVRLMDEIYRNASCVSVWLGLAPAADEYMHNRHGPIKIFDQEPFDWDEEMARLASRPYWSRFWVIQEFLLGEQVELYCSGNRIEWSLFQDILGNKAGVNLLSDTPQGAMFRAPTNLQPAVSLLVGRHPDRHPEFLLPLHELLLRHRRSECKDPRDRVFALLGLITTEERGFLERVFPNYTLSHEVVVIITLGHVKHFSVLAGETIDFNQLILALGIESEGRKETLLQRAERFDYLGISAYNISTFVDDMRMEDIIDAAVISTNNEQLDHTGNNFGCFVILVIVCVLSVLGSAYFGFTIRNL